MRLAKHRRQTICVCLRCLLSSPVFPPRRDGRVVEGGGLLNRYTGLKPVSRVRIPLPPPVFMRRSISAGSTLHPQLHDPGFCSEFCSEPLSFSKPSCFSNGLAMDPRLRTWRAPHAAPSTDVSP